MFERLRERQRERGKERKTNKDRGKERDTINWRGLKKDMKIRKGRWAEDDEIEEDGGGARIDMWEGGCLSMHSGTEKQVKESW